MLISAAFLFGRSISVALPPEQVEFFERHIRPVLAQECYECHSTVGKQKGGLVLDSREGWQKGGDSGAVIVPGNAAESLLIQSIRHTDPDLKMPSKGAKLDERVLRDFEQWVAMGAPDPRDTSPSREEIAKDTDWAAVRARRAQWWSFLPVQNPPMPEVKDAAWSEHPVDRFLLSKMEAAELSPAQDADPRTLIRRLSYVLTGLPPAPDEVEAFVRDYSSFVSAPSGAESGKVKVEGNEVEDAVKDEERAMERAVDRLLASPRFGERWARHWMDWVRYAETHGSEGDPAIPFAWRYRDYLIRAWNADVPFPQLLREAIAGDLLDNPRLDRDRGINESALGPAQLRLVLHGFTPTDALDEQVTFTDNQIDTISKAFLGLTVSCARCHDHKFDAISQTDFYALYGILASCRPATIDVNAPGRAASHIDTLAKLKGRLRAALAEEWLRRIDEAGARLRAWRPRDDKERAALLEANASPLAAWLRLVETPAEKWPEQWNRLRAEWQKSSERLAAFRAQETFARWDLREPGDFAQWTRDGDGAQGAASAGEFTLAMEGERVVTGIFPAGILSHALSDKTRAVLASPRFGAEGGKLWVRARGGGNARLRPAVRNYPRTGLVFPKHELASETDTWIGWPLDYWKGDTLHVEATTEADQPVETKNVERSWFGISEVIYSKDDKTPAPPLPGAPLLALCDPRTPAPQTADELAALYSSVLRRCVEAWREGRMRDEEAEFLGAFVRHDLLPNRLAELPEVAPLVAKYRQTEGALPAPTRAPGVLEGFAFDQALFVRGDHKQPGAPVPRRFLEALDPRPYPANAHRSGRHELAKSLAATDNPLTSRVIVNRLWHHVFGRGLVATPDNFGRLGELPSHPELLDFLATRFAAEGGSMKNLIRLLVTSRAFRLESRAAPADAERDPENRLLSRFPARRLEAEAIRDSMLALTGKLDCADGVPADGGSYRRSVYTKVIRNNLDPFLSAFDFPVPSATRGSRDVTNVPAQSLALLNAPTVAKWSADWARRIGEDRKLADEEARVRRMFAEAFGREPAEQELAESVRFVSEGAGDAKATSSAWRAFAQALFSAKEFIWLR